MVQALNPDTSTFCCVDKSPVADIHTDMVPLKPIEPQDYQAGFLRFIKPNPPPAFFLFAHGLVDFGGIFTGDPVLRQVDPVPAEYLFG